MDPEWRETEGGMPEGWSSDQVRYRDADGCLRWMIVPDDDGEEKPARNYADEVTDDADDQA